MVTTMDCGRRKNIEDFLIENCKKSAILYERKYPSIKYLVGAGKIVYVEKSRMLDIVEVMIPDYEAERDEILMSDIFHSCTSLICCESHDYNEYHYVYSIMLL